MEKKKERDGCKPSLRTNNYFLNLKKYISRITTIAPAIPLPISAPIINESSGGGTSGSVVVVVVVSVVVLVDVVSEITVTITVSLAKFQ